MGNQLEDKRFRAILGNKIRNLRKAAGKTQVELARELGFSSTGTISQIESGHRGLKIGSIIKAAKALDVHPIVLMTPYQFRRDEIEIVSELFKFFEKRKSELRPVALSAREFNKFLCRFIHGKQ